MARIRGTNNSETLNGTSGADSITGGGGVDIIIAGSGNDFITGGDGADYIHGGSGIDTADYSDSTRGVFVHIGGGAGRGGTAEGDILYFMENLIGSNYADHLIGDYGNNVLSGGAGHDILDGAAGADILWGDSGNDTLTGGRGADVLNGGLGVDTANYVFSSTGVFISLITDTAAYGDAEGDDLNSIENVTGSNYHDDILWGNNGANVLNGGGGNDSLKGFGGDDTLVGGGGTDSMDGGAGNDTMLGGYGNDSYYVDSASDVVRENDGLGQGIDVVYSTAVSYTLTDSVEILSLDTATDTGVYGTGNAQANTIFGNVNDNVLNGGGGSDSLSGLGGNDTFVFQAGQAHGDVVYEFNGNGAGVGDVLRFEGYGPGATLNQLTATEWIVASADGTISEVFTLVGGSAIDASDYVFV